MQDTPGDINLVGLAPSQGMTLLSSRTPLKVKSGDSWGRNRKVMAETPAEEIYLT